MPARRTTERKKRPRQARPALTASPSSAAPTAACRRRCTSRCARWAKARLRWSLVAARRSRSRARPSGARNVKLQRANPAKPKTKRSQRSPPNRRREPVRLVRAAGRGAAPSRVRTSICSGGSPAPQATKGCMPCSTYQTPLVNTRMIPSKAKTSPAGRGSQRLLSLRLARSG